MSIASLRGMNTHLHEIERLEEELIRTMVALLVRDSNAWSRIELALWSVRQAGIDMAEATEYANPLPCKLASVHKLHS